MHKRVRGGRRGGALEFVGISERSARLFAMRAKGVGACDGYPSVTTMIPPSPTIAAIIFRPVKGSLSISVANTKAMIVDV